MFSDQRDDSQLSHIADLPNDQGDEFAAEYDMYHGYSFGEIQVGKLDDPFADQKVGLL
jgi:hypothetical protein